MLSISGVAVINYNKSIYAEQIYLALMGQMKRYVKIARGVALASAIQIWHVKIPPINSKII